MAENSVSQGTFGLSHFRNSRASAENFEPLYNNLFTIQLALPAGVGATDQDTNLLLENVTKITGLQTHLFPTSLVTQTYKWAQRRFVGAKPERTTLDVGISFEVNLNKTPSAYVIKTLRKWCDLAMDPLTGRTGLKIDYTAKWGLITIYNRAAVPVIQYKLYNLFPMSQIPAIELDYNSNEIYKIDNFLLSCDYYDETIL